MKNKEVIGGVLVVLAIIAGYLLARPVMAPTQTTTATTTGTQPVSPAKPNSQPKFQIGSSTIAEPSFAHFDTATFVSTSTYPVITGTANIPKVGIIIYGSNGAGIVGTANIPVTDGRWSYAASITFAQGSYSVRLFGGAETETAKLTVK